MLGYTFIQVSISSFTKHDVGNTKVSLAFQRPTAPTPPPQDFDDRNQIEKYLDGAFGGQHRANINQQKHFEVFKDTEQKAFRIVYICGNQKESGNPHHTQKVAEYPDILYVNYSEVKMRLFGTLFK